MAKRQGATKTSGRNSRQGSKQSREQQPVSATMRSVAQTGGSERSLTLAEEREARANEASGAGRVTARGAATQQQPKPKASKEELAKGTPRKEQKTPEMLIQGANLDHASLNHTRERAQDGAVRSDGGPGRTEARGSTPWPQNITDMSEAEAAEAIRTTDKADILYKWRNDERASDEPRGSVIDLIYEKLLRVQGPPLPPE